MTWLHVAALHAAIFTLAIHLGKRWTRHTHTPQGEAMTKRPATRGLTFTPGNHTYRLDGKPVPGYSSIISCLDKPAIPKWAAAQVAEYVATNPDGVEQLRALGERGMIAALKEVPWKRRDDAATRGTTIHDIAEQLLLDQEVDVPDDLVPVAENLLRFYDQWHIEPILLEQPVASREHWYAGTLDLIARYKRPDTGATGIAIWDYKSGKAIYPECAMQLAAYAGAEFYGLNGDEHALPEVDAAFGVHVRADSYDVVPLRHGPEVFAEWLDIRRAFDVVKRMRGDWRKPGSGYAGVAIQGNAA